MLLVILHQTKKMQNIYYFPVMEKERNCSYTSGDMKVDVSLLAWFRASTIMIVGFVLGLLKVLHASNAVFSRPDGMLLS